MHDLVRAALGHKKATLISTLGTKINNMICGPDDIHHLSRHDNDSSGLGTVRYFFTLYRTSLPLNTALFPNSSSMRMSWLYLARRSLREVDPGLICPVRDRPQGRQARVLGLTRAMGYDRGEPGAVGISMACMVSVIVPIWFTLMSMELAQPFPQCRVSGTSCWLRRCRRPLSVPSCQGVASGASSLSSHFPQGHLLWKR